VVVVEEKSPNKEGASGPAGFGPQAQSGEARGRCKGPISGSTRDPALHQGERISLCRAVSGADINVNSGFMKSLESAKAVVTVLVDVLVPTGYIRFAPDGA
jgi:hypothetical protein